MNSGHLIVLFGSLALLFSWIGGYVENDYTFFLTMFPYTVPIIAIASIYGSYLDKEELKSKQTKDNSNEEKQ